jgi:hypothetical protein
MLKFFNAKTDLSLLYCATNETWRLQEGPYRRFCKKITLPNDASDPGSEHHKTLLSSVNFETKSLSLVPVLAGVGSRGEAGLF